MKKSRGSVFIQYKSVELILILGLVAGLVFFIISSGEINLILACFGGIALALIIHKLYELIYGKVYLRNIQAREEILLEGDLPELILMLSNNGFVLRKTLGEFLFFETDYKILPRSWLIAGQGKDGCFIQAQKAVTNILRKDVKCKELAKKSEINNSNVKASSYDD